MSKVNSYYMENEENLIELSIEEYYEIENFDYLDSLFISEFGEESE